MSSWQGAAAKLEFERVRERILRHVSSEPGAELVRNISVATDIATVRGALQQVSEMKHLLEEEEGLVLGEVQPIGPALARSAIEGAVLQPKELLQIVMTLRAARHARGVMAKHRETAILLWQISEGLTPDKVLEFNIDQAIDESGAVKTSASRELQTVRRAIAERSDQLRKKLETILRSVSDLGFSQEEIITTREGRMVIPVKTEHKRNVPGFIHSASASGATVFVEPTETLELNNDIRSLQFQEQREVERILAVLSGQIRDRRTMLEENLRILALLDFHQAKARYSIEVLGIEPVVNTSGPLRLVKARHPVLLLNHGQSGTVPLDVELGRGFRTLVISGPNAGGKSVAMKCVGLLALMGQSGLHIPAADGTQLKVFSDLHVDIGDDQSIENDLSTFSSHLRNLKTIVDSANGESLVLIDEIGSGTDPAEGGAIAASILEQLTKSGAYTIATTHHSALKVFAHETDGVENGAMEFDQANLTPTYRFHAGVPGSSYALEMAQRLGFPPQILSLARSHLGEQQARLDSLITTLESSLQQSQAELGEISKEKSELERITKEYEAKMESAAREIKTMKQRALEDARGIVDQANAVIERSVRQIKETKADQATVKAVRQDVEELRQVIQMDQREIAPVDTKAANTTIAVGSFVTLGTGSDVGEVVAIAADGRSATVVYGTVKMRVNLGELHAATKRRTHHPNIVSAPEKPESVETTLDLRGMTGEEAVPQVDKFLDTAILAGLHRVDIIHGKGTGALRKRVTEFLSQHPRVASYRLGEWNEGGTGATVVELREQE
ncbi:MAG: endonuclease MutS2 [Bacteroidota bacterium]